MPANTFTIEFSGKIFTEEGNALLKSELDIQFFNVESSAWESLLEKQTTNRGILKAQYVVPTKISSGNPIARIIKDVVFSGAIPNFRIVLKTEKVTNILGQHTASSVDNNSNFIFIDFGNNWILPESMYQKTNENNTQLIATNFPYLDLYKLNERLLSDNENLKKEFESISKQKNNLELGLEECLKNSKKLKSEFESLYNLLNECKKDQASNLKKIEELSSQVQNLVSEKNVLVEKNKQQSIELENLTKLKKESDKTNIQLTQNIEKKDLEIKGNLETINKLNDELKKLNELLIQENKVSGIKNKEYLTQVAILEQEIVNLKNKLEDSSKQFLELGKEKDELEKLLSECKVRYNEKEALFNSLKLANEVNKESLIDINKAALIKDEEITKLRGNIQTNEKTILDLEAKVNAYLISRPDYIAKAMPASDIYANVIAEISKTKEMAAGSGFKLASISLNLKTFAEKDQEGLRFQLLDVGQSKEVNAAAISDIKIDISEDNTGARTVSRAPNLLGLTETAARNLLTTYKYKMEAIYHGVESNSGTAFGQAFKQYPNPGEELSDGAIVSVFFAKDKTNFN